MKKLYTHRVLTYLIVGGVIGLPHLAAAQLAKGPDAGPLGDLLANILVFANDVLIPFIIGIGFLFFVWGMFRYFILGGADEEQRAKGRSLLIHATLGFVMIIIFVGIVNMLASSIGLEGESIKSVPQAVPATK